MNLDKALSTSLAREIFDVEFLEECLGTLDLSNVSLDELLQNSSLEKVLVDIKEYISKHISSATITAVIMVKNQEKYIENAIESAEIVADRVVVMDTGSNDKTVPIIKNLRKEKIFIFEDEWVEDFSVMRNKLMGYVDQGWVITIDSDEVFKDFKLKFFKNTLVMLEALELLLDLSIGISLRQYASFTNSEFGIAERIINQDSAHSIQSVGQIHEEFKSTHKKLLMVNSNISIVNLGKRYDEMVRFNKVKRYHKLLMNMIKQDPNNPRWASVVELDALEDGLENDWYYRLLLSANFEKDKIFMYSGVRVNKYTHYNLERLLLVLLSRKDESHFKRVLKISQKLFPNSVTFLFYEYLERRLTLQRSVNLEIEDMINRVSMINAEDAYSIDQRGIDTFKAILLKNMITVGRYKDAKKLFYEIRDDAALNFVEAEKLIFTHQEGK